MLATDGYPALAQVEVQTLHALCRRLLHLAADHGLGRLRRGFRISETVEERNEQGVVLKTRRHSCSRTTSSSRASMTDVPERSG